ncbi:MAG: isocitrate/isopropylmalate family dehydrogenase [Candidimonas sp.]
MRIALIEGEGIGPEITKSVVEILKIASPDTEFVNILVDYQNGLTDENLNEIEQCDCLLKGPIGTSLGNGVRSLNVSLRQHFDLYANVRPAVSWLNRFKPFDPHRKNLDLIVIRENVEDIYQGVEYRHGEYAYAVKTISRYGSERIIRHAFEYAKMSGRNRVCAMSKPNIMKQTDGLFMETFNAISKEYPDIDTKHMIVDIGMARVVSRPEDFSIIVTENLYGDILSDITTEMSGSVGLGCSSNIGENFSMFEAVHGTAPDITGLGIANPSGLLMAACEMFYHHGKNEIANNIFNAWLVTLEDGILTTDMNDFSGGVSTGVFTNSIIARLDHCPKKGDPVDRKSVSVKIPQVEPYSTISTIEGYDILIKGDYNNDYGNPIIIHTSSMMTSKEITTYGMTTLRYRGVELNQIVENLMSRGYIIVRVDSLAITDMKISHWT